MSTNLLSIGSQHYAAGIYKFTITLPAGVQSLNLSMTRQSWPTGIAINSMTVNDPSGVEVAASGAAAGGAAQDPDGNAINYQTMQIGAPQGGTLQPGVYSVTFDIAQPLSTAIDVDSMP